MPRLADTAWHRDRARRVAELAARAESGERLFEPGRNDSQPAAVVLCSGCDALGPLVRNSLPAGWVGTGRHRPSVKPGGVRVYLCGACAEKERAA